MRGVGSTERINPVKDQNNRYASSTANEGIGPCSRHKFAHRSEIDLIGLVVQPLHFEGQFILNNI